MASERYIVIPNWDEFQHYKDKTRPTWIRLYPRLLRNDEFTNLAPGDRAALIGIWMLYAEKARRLADDTAMLTRSLSQRVTRRTLNRLNDAGFIEFRSRDALDAVYSREEKSREEISLKDQRAARGATAERDIHRGKSSRGKGWVDNLGRYTGCRYVRGEFALTAKYDPLGMEPPPSDWPYERPSREEIAAALKEANA